jgi:hypothetical protein
MGGKTSATFIQEQFLDFCGVFAEQQSSDAGCCLFSAEQQQGVVSGRTGSAEWLQQEQLQTPN